MDTNTILLIANLIVSFLNPLILALSMFIKQIRKSKCWGSEIVLNSPTASNIEEVNKNILDTRKSSHLQNIIDRLSSNKKPDIDLTIEKNK